MNGDEYFRLHINGDVNQIPVVLERKKAKPRKKKKNPLRSGFTVEILPEDDYYGFSLDGDHLYLTADFTVHHNTGKSALIASQCADIHREYSGVGSLIIAPRKELIAQNSQTMLRIWPCAPIGINCSKLGRRDTRQPIIFATVNSIYRNPGILGTRDHIQIDEAHLLPPGEEGMYHDVIQHMLSVNPYLRVSGYTATPYRTDMGRLDGKGGLYEKTVYEYGIGEGIRDGWLCPLASPPGKRSAEIDVSNVPRSGGDFQIGAMGRAADEITEQAVEEIIELGANRRKWLVFSSGVQHAMSVCEAFRRRGISAEVIYGDMNDGERDSILKRFKSKAFRVLVNADILTTGFDDPEVDLIGVLRSVLSTSLIVQIWGRGTRVVWPQGFDPNEATVEERREAIEESSKPNCLAVDFGGNIRRHGPVDQIEVESRDSRGNEVVGKVSVNSVRSKHCPVCETEVGLATMQCPTCDHEWPKREPKHDAVAEREAKILSDGQAVAKSKWLEVKDTSFHLHHKIGAPTSLRIEYEAGLGAPYKDYLAFEQKGKPRQRAGEVWRRMGGDLPIPKTAEDALARVGELKIVTAISVRRPKPKSKYFNVVDRQYAEHRALEAAE
ncbi:helicase-related protein [Roseibium algicola]|uniref:helicase-related protein n=1 Tax=Roseibium algicola TaxID=2857014 RepID=UPI001D1729F0|nr:helicase-related protein [Roseibium aggregatum]